MRLFMASSLFLLCTATCSKQPTNGSSSSGGSPSSGGSTSSSTGGQAGSSGGSSSKGSTTSSGGTTGAAGSSGGTSSATGSGGGNGGSASSGSMTASGGSATTNPQGGSSSGSGGSGGGTSGGSSGSSASTGGAKGGASSSGGGSGGSSTSTGGATGGTTEVASMQGYSCSTINGTSAQQLFMDWYGKWSTKYYTTCGTDLARIKGCNGDDNTCSEGIGYGMILTVAAGDQTAFDRLNRFRAALGKEYDKVYTSGGLMAWNSGNSCPPSASSGNANNAPDGDLDAAMALIQASKKWPSGTYKTDALALIDGIWSKNVGTSGGKPYLGAGTINIKDKSYTSYWTLGYFQVFARFVSDSTKQQNWKSLASRGYEVLKAIQANSACNGEFPEAFQVDGTMYSGDNCDFGYDSCRVPWRLATDYAWFGTADSKTMLDSIRSNVVKGDPVSNARQRNSAFAGGLALSGISADQATMDNFCKKWVDAKTAGNNFDDSPYFQNTLGVLYLLVAGGLFDRVVAP